MEEISHNKKDIYRSSRLMFVFGDSLSNLIISFMATGAIFTKLALYLGISDSSIATINSLLSIASIFQLFSIKVFKNERTKNKLLIFHFAYALFFTLLYFIPYIPSGTGTRTILFTIFLMAGFSTYNLGAPARVEWIFSVVEDKKRGTYTAAKEIVVLISSILFSFYMSVTLDRYYLLSREKESFLFCFIVCLVITALFILTTALTKEKVSYIKPEKRSTFKTIKAVLFDKNFKPVLIITFLWSLCLNISNPYIYTYQIKDLGFSLSFMAVLTAISSLTRISSCMLWGKYADKHSFTKMLNLCYPIVFFAYLTLALTNPSNGKVMIIIHTVLIALSQGGTSPAETNLIYDYVGIEKLKTAMSIKSVFSGIIGFLATVSVVPLVNLIQKSGNMLFGISVYAQQVLSCFSLFFAIILYFYTSRLLKKS